MFRIMKAEMLATDNQGPLNGRILWKHPNGTIFDGDWRNGIPHGNMTVTFRDGTRMTTQYCFGTIQGHTIVERLDGYRWEGEFCDGKENGQGSIRWPDGCSYEGNFTALLSAVDE